MSTGTHLHGEGAEAVLGLESGLDALRSSPEFRGPVESLDGHHCNDHFALIYEDREEQFAAVVPFVRQGLERGERCMYVVDDERSREETVAAMRAGGIDVDAAIDSGALSFHVPEETYLRNGRFDGDEMIALYADLIDETTEEYEALRIAAEMEWILDDTTDIQAFMDYESKVNELFEGEDCIAMCQYDRTAIPDETIRQIVRTHPHLVYENTVCHNFYYTPPEEFFGPERPTRQVDRMMNTLLDRTRAKTQLRERRQSLRDLYEITSRTGLAFEKKIRELLEFGCERFGVDIGFLSSVAGEDFEIVEAVGGHERIQPGRETSLSGTYCRQVLEADGPVSVENAAAEGWEGSEAYETYGLDAYLGATVTVGDDVYGTLCFASRAASTDRISESDLTFLELMGHWVSYELEREHRQVQLSALNEMSCDLMAAESHESIAEIAANHAAETLQLPLTALLFYDEETGELVPTAQTDRAEDELPMTTLCSAKRGPLWEAFVANETRFLDDVGSVQGAANDLTEVAALPLGRKGLFVTATKQQRGFSDAEFEFVETTAVTVETALDRADREQLLQDRERTLETQNETLERLNRINDIIRNIDQALVQASSREEIERVVCEQLADVGPYELAWIGEHDSLTDEITPREWAGAERGYLDQVEVSVDEATGQGPAGRAVRTREPQVVNNVLDDPSFEPLRQAALNRGYHATIGLPLVYGDVCYGVLNVYADQPGVFDDLERSVLAEMGDTIAYAMNTAKSKKALVSDEVTELEFAVDDSGLEIVELARETGCGFSLESVVPGADGRLRVFISTRGAPADDVLDFAPQLAATDLALVGEFEDDGEPVCLFEATLDDGSLCETVRTHGGRPQTVSVEDGEATVVVEIAADADVREFVEMFRANYPDSELVAQRSRERPRRTRTEFRAALTENLTVRQLEALQTAYFSGYFEQPRSRTGSEIAATMDISQPTFNSHVRAAQRKVCHELFDGEPIE